MSRMLEAAGRRDCLACKGGGEAMDERKTLGFKHSVSCVRACSRKRIYTVGLSSRI